MELGRKGVKMIKGQKAKQEIFTKVQALFPDSFMDNKDLRINIIEDGELVQIKLTLTASKTIIKNSNSAPIGIKDPQGNKNMTEPTEEEKIKVAEALKSLGMELR